MTFLLSLVTIFKAPRVKIWYDSSIDCINIGVNGRTCKITRKMLQYSYNTHIVHNHIKELTKGTNVDDVDILLRTYNYKVCSMCSKSLDEHSTEEAMGHLL